MRKLNLKEIKINKKGMALIVSAITLSSIAVFGYINGMESVMDKIEFINKNFKSIKEFLSNILSTLNIVFFAGLVNKKKTSKKSNNKTHKNKYKNKKKRR